jgi:hypothetical protein
VAFVGALEVVSDVYEIDHEDDRIWASDLYPVRFDVKLLLRVPVDKGVRLDAVRGIAGDPPVWGWVYRNSLNEIPQADGAWIMSGFGRRSPN